MSDFSARVYRLAFAAAAAYNIAFGLWALLFPNAFFDVFDLAPPRYPAIWARAGKWLAFDSAERNGKDHDLYVVQPSDPKSKRMVAQEPRRCGASSPVLRRVPN